MNIAIILSGGVGKRFGSEIPKQYHDLCGKPVIQYVIDTAYKAKNIDNIVLAIDKNYLSILNNVDNPKMHIVSNGKERLDSVKNCLDYIKNNFDKVENVIILQAVSPFITANLIEEYINFLNDYDVVVTAEKCPGEIFNIHEYKKMNRNDFYFVQSPEAFKFSDLYKFIDVNSQYSELVYHYKYEPKIKYYTDFKNNIKLTHKIDLEYARFLMEDSNKKSN